MPYSKPTRRFRLRFSLRQLFLVVALVAIGFGTWRWLFRKEVVVGAAEPGDGVLRNYYGTFEGGWRKRNILVASGSFTKDTELSLHLYIIRSGTIEQASGCRMHRSRNISGPFWTSIKFWLDLGEKDTPRGRVMGIGFAEEVFKMVDASFSRSDVPHNINFVTKKTLPGTITPGRPHIAYVEGDQAIVVDGSMTVKEFAKANPGNYLVVTVEVK